MDNSNSKDESLNDQGIPKHLVKHFNQNAAYFNKLLNKNFNEAEVKLTPQDTSRIKEAYEKAHHIREYEINLFWSRLNYLWTITAVLFAAWGVLLNSVLSPEEGRTISDVQYFALFLISIFGVVLTMLSSFITKAGKHWQQVWEYHVVTLEPFQSGSLYSLKFESSTDTAPSISRSVVIFHWFLLLTWSLSAVITAIAPFVKDDKFMFAEIIVLGLIWWLYSLISKHVSKPSTNSLKLVD
ncbi:hypothetical protein [Siccibacter turicensis]|uniref:RipA family octameric membrane protein n=1 Tax=Siccibacter TaxID=1649298 RepID=UPI00101F9C9F|nr:hypothetical protein [Siccibacter turicensis]